VQAGNGRYPLAHGHATQVVEQFREAATALIRDQFAGIRSLKNRIYG
jgi:hypothetical protein